MANGTCRNARKHPSKAPATAPGQLLGYGLQYTRLTAKLLAAAPGTSCAIEVLDDVSETAEDGKTTLVQTKSTLTANPVADRAIPLWKTLANWPRLSQLGFVDPNTTNFKLYVSREVKGDLIALMTSGQHLLPLHPYSATFVCPGVLERFGKETLFRMRHTLKSIRIGHLRCLAFLEQAVLKKKGRSG